MAKSSTPRRRLLELGATDASVINATTGHGLDMEDPATGIDEVFTVHGTTNVCNNLQGTLGLVKDFTNGNDGIFGTGNLLVGQHLRREAR